MNDRQDDLRAEARGRGLLRRLQRAKETNHAATPTIAEVLPRASAWSAKGQDRDAAMVVSAWEKMLPRLFRERVELDRFAFGVLWIRPASDEVYHELIDLLDAGLRESMLAACAAAGLKRIELINTRIKEDVNDRDDRTPDS